jgi:hypothetical protein
MSNGVMESLSSIGSGGSGNSKQSSPTKPNDRAPKRINRQSIAVCIHSKKKSRKTEVFLSPMKNVH